MASSSIKFSAGNFDGRNTDDSDDQLAIKLFLKGLAGTKAPYSPAMVSVAKIFPITLVALCLVLIPLVFLYGRRRLRAQSGSQSEPEPKGTLPHKSQGIPEGSK